jgi:hypothetical protein
MGNRKHLLHYRNGQGNAKPSAASLVNGEIAMTYTDNYEKLYIKNSVDRVIDFSSDHIINERIDSQDKNVSDAIGLTIDTESSDEVNYVYKPSNQLLTECKTVNDSIEYLAGKLEESLNLINQLKSNVYVTLANFTVEYDRENNQQILSFNLTNGGETTVSSQVVIEKYEGDNTTSSVVYHGEMVSSGTTTDIVDSNKERYVLYVTPSLSGALTTKVEETRYMCYVASYADDDTCKDNIVKSNAFRYMSNGISFTASLTTGVGEYIYILVPTYIRVLYVMNDGITVPMTELSNTIGDGSGDFRIYKNTTALDDCDWNLTIYHVR